MDNIEKECEMFLIKRYGNNYQESMTKKQYEQLLFEAETNGVFNNTKDVLDKLLENNENIFNVSAKSWKNG